MLRLVARFSYATYLTVLLMHIVSHVVGHKFLRVLNIFIFNKFAQETVVKNSKEL